jgi:adenylate cyclase
LAAIRTAVRLLAGVGHGPAGEPWLEVGIGIHSGPAFVGTIAVGSEVTDFTALGDTVNAASRLASEASGGEILISEDALATAGLELDELERRELTLRGREASLAVRVAHHDSLSEALAA